MKNLLPNGGDLMLTLTCGHSHLIEACDMGDNRFGCTICGTTNERQSRRLPDGGTFVHVMQGRLPVRIIEQAIANQPLSREPLATI